MKKKEEHEIRTEQWILPFVAIRKLFLFFIVIFLLVEIVLAAVLTISTMKDTAQAAYESVHAQISQKVAESLKLLKGLASLPEFYEPSIPWAEKVAKLDQLNESFGYMFICYVDEDIKVYTIGEEPADLASREHMQKLYTLKQPIVTDSFIAGADGVTLNYTVAVPLMKEDVMTGSLFCSIYFDDTVTMLQETSDIFHTSAVLIGSQGQIMSSSEQLPYGTAFTEYLKDSRLFRVTTDELESRLLSRERGDFHHRQGWNYMVSVYGPIPETNWDVLVTVDFLTAFQVVLPSLFLMTVAHIFLMGWLYYFVRKHMQKQRELVEDMVASIHKMEKKLYWNKVPEDVNYNDIIELTSKGLRDSLTGVVTRTVFLDRMEKLMKEEDTTRMLVLCFVDLDDLKRINDVYGHFAGDQALKKIGTTLRIYEKKYDGIAGRYGGDEFVLVLQDLEHREELQEVLQGLVQDLKVQIDCDGELVDTHCSIGACIWNHLDALDVLMSKADKALYDVKRHGKQNYALYLDGSNEDED